MREWFTAAEIAAVSGAALPNTVRGLNLHAERQGWRDDAKRARWREESGGGWEYQLALLPSEVQARLIAGESADRSQTEEEARRAGLWAHFSRLPQKTKDKALRRLDLVNRVETLSSGMPLRAAVALAAKEASVSSSALWTWWRACRAVHRSDRLAALAPRYAGCTVTAGCALEAWEFLKRDYLRPEQPSFEACYRRMIEAARANNWTPIPSEKTLRRRITREFPRAVRILMRDGAEAAKRTFPHQQRDRSVFHAMQAVNADGHTLDVRCRWPDGKIERPVIVAIQDLLSGKIVGHRLDRSENWPAVRLAFADAVQSFGIPELCYLDNGRAFASKWITGRMQTRYRFKVREDEPEGVLTALGVKVSWVTPYHGQAKPIERAFRDFCEEIARHPFCAGAYTGSSPGTKPANYGERAIAIEKFEIFLAQQVARHNLRAGRRTDVAKGRSFEETFRESYARAIVKKATAEQLYALMLAAEGVTCRKPDGSIYLGDNRYWDERLSDHAGRKVMVRFDPQNLFLPIAVYALDGRFVGEAECREKTGFNDIEAARAHAKQRQLYMRRLREVRDMEIAMSVEDLVRLQPPPELTPPPEPKVIRLVANARPQPAPIEADEDVWKGAESFGRAARKLEASLLQFPNPTTDPA